MPKKYRLHKKIGILFAFVLIFSFLSHSNPTQAQGSEETNYGQQNILLWEFDLKVKKPLLEINIPGLRFSNVVSTTNETGTYYFIPWIPELISALYNFGIGIVSIVAVIMIIVQGVHIIASRGGEGKSASYKKIGQALIGLLIAWGSFAILYNINPATTEFNALKVKTVEPIELDDESLVDLPEVSDTTPVGGGTGVIGSVIGAYPSRFAPCSKEGAQYAAQKLHDAAICVGPCNCAWSSSYFLNYIGCTNLKHGNTTKLEKLLEGIGWVRRPITKENRKNLPVGLLVGKGHVGVSLGNGLQFQSGGLKEDWKEMNQRGKGNCPAIGRDSYANPAPCNFCTKISGIRPIVSPEHKDGWNARCSSNQVWDKDTIWNTFWYDIISPPGS